MNVRVYTSRHNEDMSYGKKEPDKQTCSFLLNDFRNFSDAYWVKCTYIRSYNSRYFTRRIKIKYIEMSDLII